MKFKDLFPLLKDTFAAFGQDKISRLAAALSYYTIFSIAPILVVILSIAAIFFNAESARAGLMNQIGEVVGPTGADAISEILTNANKAGQGGNIVASIIGIATVLVGASGLFAALQDSLNTVWGVAPKPDAGIGYLIRSRFLSFAMVLGIGFLLIVSLAASTFVKAGAGWVSQLLGGAAWIAPLSNVIIFFFVLLILFAAIFKVLPDAKVQWHDVWVGAALTSVLFSVGKFALSWYLSRPGTASAYGSAGALVVLLLWINYASMILFFGAEFTKVYANKFGSHIEPDEDAIAVSDEARARQGLVPHPQVKGAKTADKSGLVGPIKGDALPSDKNLSPAEKTAKIAELRAEARKNFEFSMAVVAGALAAVVWALKRRENHHLKIIERDADAKNPAIPTSVPSLKTNPKKNPKWIRK